MKSMLMITLAIFSIATFANVNSELPVERLTFSLETHHDFLRRQVSEFSVFSDLNGRVATRKIKMPRTDKLWLQFPKADDEGGYYDPQNEVAREKYLQLQENLPNLAHIRSAYGYAHLGVIRKMNGHFYAIVYNKHHLPLASVFSLATRFAGMSVPDFNFNSILLVDLTSGKVPQILKVYELGPYRVEVPMPHSFQLTIAEYIDSDLAKNWAKPSEYPCEATLF